MPEITVGEIIKTFGEAGPWFLLMYYFWQTKMTEIIKNQTAIKLELKTASEKHLAVLAAVDSLRESVRIMCYAQTANVNNLIAILSTHGDSK